jgi:hypothetical protein
METQTAPTIDNRPQVFFTCQVPRFLWSLVSGSINYDVDVPISALPRLDLFLNDSLVSISRFFLDLDFLFLVRFFSGGFTNVHDTTARLDSILFSDTLGFTTHTTIPVPPSPVRLYQLDIPNSITNVQIKRDSVDRCSPFLGVGSLFPTDNSIRNSMR